MTTLTIPFSARNNQRGKRLPTTSRGRALYTVAWFLHGKVANINYDQRVVALRQLANA